MMTNERPSQVSDPNAHLNRQQSGGIPSWTAEDAQQSGPCAGIIESLSLFSVVPGFARLCLFIVIMSGGVTVPWTYVLPPLQSKFWGDEAASYTAFMQAGRSFLSMFLAAHFGKWSDRRGRRLASLFVMTVGGFCIAWPVLILGSSETALWICAALIVVTGPVAVHLTGSPVIWAFAADILPPEHRETGFAIIMASTSLGNFSIQLLSKLLAGMFPGHDNIYFMVSLACFAISLLLLLSLQSMQVSHDGADDDDALQARAQPGLVASLLSPLRLLWRKATLRAVCMVAAVLTFAELAASDISAQVLYAMLGLCTDCDDDSKLQEASFFYGCLPNPPLFVVTILVGVAARRFGPHRFVSFWLPVTALLFAVPALLTIIHANWAILIAGFCAILPLTNYGPLQALVVHVVPASRVGEAMGSMAACKNLVSLIAPLVIGSVAETLKQTGNTEKLWAVYPCCAVVMLCAWPLTFLLQSRVPRESNVVWSTWASTARPSLFRPSTATWRTSGLARTSAARPSASSPYRADLALS
jgi:MFS family permease